MDFSPPIPPATTWNLRRPGARPGHVPFPAPANGEAGRPAQSLPGRFHRARPADYIGAFAVTAGLGVDELVKQFKARHDDYNAIMTEALADRLAEAFAEYLHQRVRAEWGYGKHENLTIEQLIDEAIPRHPPGGRLSGLPRPHGKADACGNCSTWRRTPASD